MKMLINMISLFQSGPKTVCIGYLEGINEYLDNYADIEFIIILPNIKEIYDYFFELELDKKVRYIIVDYPNKSKFKFLKKLWIDHFYTALIGYINKADLIFMTANFASLFWFKKQIVLFHNLHYLNNSNVFHNLAGIIKLKLERILFKITLRKKPYILVQLKVIQNKLYKLYPYKDKIFLQYMSLPRKFFLKKCNQIFKMDNNYFKLILPAKFHPNKNFNIILEFAEIILKNQLAIKIYLTISKKDYENLLKNNPLLKKIIKNLNEIKYECMSEVYRNMNGLLFPSDSESYGFPLVEAIMSDLIIITLKTDFAFELLGDYPFYFDKHDTKSMEKILLLLNNKNILEEKKNELHKIKSRFSFSWIENIKFLKRLYKND